MDSQHAVRGSEVFVGGLSRSIAESKIREVFSACGQIVEVRLIKDHKGELKGYCFIRFATKEAADKAVKEKAGITLDGKKIGVVPSTEQNSLYLGNLSKDWSADEFDKIVNEAFSDIVSIDLAMPFSGGDSSGHGQKQKNRGFAFVKFSSHAAAARAHRLGSNSDFILGANCHPAVDWAKDEPDVSSEELAKIKIAFVRNLPANADEDYLKKLFEPLGKLERAVLSKKGRSPLGFVHFSERSGLDNAIKEMNGKTVQGPNGGPSIKLQVEIAKPIDKNRKRARDDSQSQPASKISSYSKMSKDEQTLTTNGGLRSGAHELKYSLEEPVVTDPYEAAVISLPVSVKERLLRILRLGIAARFDISLDCLTSLRELPESTSICILDQFMLSGAERLNKGEYLSSLISRYQVDKFGLNHQRSLSLSKIGDSATKPSPLSNSSSRVHQTAVDTLDSRAGTTLSGYDIYTSRYSSPFSTYPLSSSRLSSYGKMEENGQDHHTLSSSRLSYPKMEESGRGDPLPSRRLSYAKLEESIHNSRLPGSSSTYSKMEYDSSLTSAASDGQPKRNRVRFDPFTGEPYKFDPFTGEPIVPESIPRPY